MKHIVPFLLTMTLLCPTLLYGQTSEAQKKFTIVIDPGHGGKAPGKTVTINGKQIMEKVYTLAISQKLAELLRNSSDFKVIMTRTDDISVGLQSRANIANRAKADLFLSIHINSAPSKTVHGMRCFVLGEGKGREESNLTAIQENDDIQYEDNYQQTYEGYVPGDPSSMVMFRLMQFAAGEQSYKIAETIERNCQTDIAEMAAKKMVFAEGFWVLVKTTMPSVLVEVCFITNDGDRELMQSDEFQNRVAQMLYKSVVEYKNSMRTQNYTNIIQSRNSETTTVPAPQTQIQQPQIQPQATAVNSSAPMFYIQISAMRQGIATTAREFKSYAGKVVTRHIDGWHKYYVGGYATKAEAERVLPQVKREFPSAFIVTF